MGNHIQFKEKFMSQFIIIKYLIYYSKNYKESILIGINPLTLTKGRTDSKKKNIDYISYSTVNNNFIFNKFKALNKDLK